MAFRQLYKYTDTALIFRAILKCIFLLPVQNTIIFCAT